MNHFLTQVLRGDTVWGVGIYDALSAKLAEWAGFGAVMTGGFGVTASLLGLPDLELLSMAENVATVRRVAAAVSIPVVADIDTGYGNTINVARVMRELKTAGAQAVIMEDQISPKRCAACVDETQLIGLDEAVAKIRAAVEVSDGAIAVIARTDAFDPAEAFVRARAYAEAGAHLIQPVSKTFSRLEDLIELRRRSGCPLSIQILGWLEQLEPTEVAQVAGLATFSLVPLMTATSALMRNLSALRANLKCSGLPCERMGMEAFKNFIGFDAMIREHQRYAAYPPSLE